MLKHKKSKVKTQRGMSSHGWGHKKKHRGAGNRGGKGMAGTGARGDAKKPSILTTIGKSYYGKRGFSSIHKRTVNVLSLTFIEQNFESLTESGVIVDGTLDVSKIKVNKILGRGKLSHKLNIICEEISANAKAIVEAAGGSVEVTRVKKTYTNEPKSEE
ncbi:MAG: uL15 family ribosomal protein [Nanoarchaeales archaeon]|nr:uL15 family ribosomal protein [Nanoarchaeales archaeon]